MSELSVYLFHLTFNICVALGSVIGESVGSVLFIAFWFYILIGIPTVTIGFIMRKCKLIK